ncbi:transcriptional regulator, TetR family [Actinacidiphila yanglinensis]|uniref:Transcriptional regulator, TetR family n=1 Tax=Actinacidiphila yanglinensis TaxID=310779 RepID=A0A1H5X8J4_9ACTN|nr:transcriptional regulator, TetR family [Actinacidiphila yanglinensis]
MTVIAEVPEVAEKEISSAPRVRADALRNRERIVAAARDAFVEFGPEAPLDEIARRAGIGNATLYRHFADRRVLVHDVLLSVLVRTADHAEEAGARESDPFTALRRFAHAAVDERVGALCGLVAGMFDELTPDLNSQRDRLHRGVEALMDRARRAGQLRADVGVGDLMVALSQLTRPLPGIDCPGIEEVAHRHLHLFLDGLRPSAASDAALPGRPTVLDDLRGRRHKAPCTSS